MPKDVERIEIENFTSPGHKTRVDAGKYQAMKTAMLDALPPTAPGVTVAELKERLLPHLSDDLFPGGEKAGWWLKAVQLDLEAKGVVVRTNTKPLRLHKG